MFWIHEQKLQTRHLHFIRIPRTRTPVRQRDSGLVGDEVREKVG